MKYYVATNCLPVIEEENQKPCGLRKEQFITWKKKLLLTGPKRNEWGIVQLFTIHRVMSSPFPTAISPPSRELPQFMDWGWYSVFWSCPLVSSGQLSRPCPSQPFVHLLTEHCSQQLNHQCAVHIILALNPKRGPAAATEKTMNFVPSETRILLLMYTM